MPPPPPPGCSNYISKHGLRHGFILFTSDDDMEVILKRFMYVESKNSNGAEVQRGTVFSSAVSVIR